MKLLDATLARHPYDRDILSALAFYKARAGQRGLALEMVRQLRELDPENVEYAQMAKQIEGAAPR